MDTSYVTSLSLRKHNQLAFRLHVWWLVRSKQFHYNNVCYTFEVTKCPLPPPSKPITKFIATKLPTLKCCPIYWSFRTSDSIKNEVAVLHLTTIVVVKKADSALYEYLRMKSSCAVFIRPNTSGKNSSSANMDIRKWNVPGSCQKPEPGTMITPDCSS